VSLSSALNTAKGALFSQQMAIDVAGANIANVNTIGYSRQRAVLAAVGSVDGDSGSVSAGVAVESIERVYDAYLESQLVNQTQKTGFSDEMSSLLGRVETIFDETTDGGMNDILSEFWGAWEDLSANPTGQVERDSVVAVGDKLAAMMRTYMTDLRELQSDIDTTISQKIPQINECAAELADLNTKMIASEQGTGDTNTLEDSQVQRLQELAGLIGVTYLDDENGVKSVYLPNGTPLVEKGQYRELQLKDSPSRIVVAGRTDESLDDIIDGGQLGALLEVRDTILPSYREKLDALAGAIITAVNEQQRLGYDRYGNAGGDFFDSTSLGAQTMGVSAAVVADANMVAASSTVAGDGDNARKIAAIKDALIMSSSTATIGEGYASFIGKVGLDASQAKRSADHNQLVMDQVSNQRESVSGVSIDEEMLSLIRYQMGYNAAGKLTQTINELLDTLMSLVQ
jgi:flagellar hook-associated protein 1